MASIPTKEMKLTDARAHFSELLTEVHREGTRISITKSGIPVGAIISVEDLKRLQRLEEKREQEFAALDEIGTGFIDVPWEEIEAQADRAVAALRAEQEAIRPPADRRAVAETASEDYDETGGVTRPADQGRRGVA